MQAVILAGGRGRRLGTLTEGKPKPLVEIGGRPFILSLIRMLSRFGFTDILLLVGPFQSTYEAVLGDGSRDGVRVTLVPEEPPADTAGALRVAAPILAERFLLLNGDSLFDFNVLDLTARRKPGPWLAALALREVENAARYGAVKLSGRRVTAFGEKTAAGRDLVNGGVYWVKRDMLTEIGPPPVSLEREVFPRLAARGLLVGFPYHGHFIDIGTPEDLANARQRLPAWERRPAAFLDRDGVLNRDAGYVHRKEEFIWCAGAKRAIKRLNDRGYFVFVVTNQSAVARGLCTEAEVLALHRWVNAELRRGGAHVDAWYVCPHHPRDGVGPYRQTCLCRKPAPGLLLQALAEWPVNREASVLIGDQQTDLLAAEAARLRGILATGDNLDTIVSGILARTIHGGSSRNRAVASETGARSREGGRRAPCSTLTD